MLKLDQENSTDVPGAFEKRLHPHVQDRTNHTHIRENEENGEI